MRNARTLIIAALFSTILSAACGGPSPITDPISVAIVRGETAEAIRLVDARVPAEGAGNGFTPLAWAARTNNTDAIDALIRAGANAGRRDPRNGWPPLIHAIHKGRTEAVLRLLTHGAPVNGTTRGGVTPLMVAAGDGRPEIVRLLLDHGADPTLRRDDGATALTLAVSGGAMTNLERPLLGRCQPEVVRMIHERAPALKLGSGPYDRIARVFASWNGCETSLAMAR